MKRNKTTDKRNMNDLIFEYEAMSQKGTVGFYEKTVFLQLIDHYLSEQLFDTALELAGHAISQHPFSGTFYIIQAQLYIEKNCEKLALEALDKAMLYSPSVFEIQILRAEVLSLLREYKEAFKTLEALLPKASPEQRSEIYLSKALIYESIKQYQSMFGALKKSVFSNPENAEALERVWFCVEMTQEYDESIRFHKKFINNNPYSYIAWYNLGYAFSAKGNYKHARDAFEYAFIINDKFEFAYRECAECCIKLKKYKQALRCYDEFLEYFEGDADLFTKIGTCHEALGDIENAQTNFLKAVTLDKNNDEVHYRLGNCFLKQNRFGPAISSFKKAVLIDGLKEEYYLALAEVYFKTNELEMAHGFFQKATDVAPDICKSWTNYANFLMLTGKNELALNVLDEAELYSFGPELMYCKVACLFSLGHRNAALELLEKAFRKNFKSRKYLFEIAPTLLADKDVKALISGFSC